METRTVKRRVNRLGKGKLVIELGEEIRKISLKKLKEIEEFKKAEKTKKLYPVRKEGDAKDAVD